MLSLWMLSELALKECCAPAMGLRMTTIKDHFLLKISVVLSKCLLLVKIHVLGSPKLL